MLNLVFAVSKERLPLTKVKSLTSVKGGAAAHTSLMVLSEVYH